MLRIGSRSALLAGSLAVLALGACNDAEDDRIDPIECPALDADAMPNVVGLFDYASEISAVYGTITFEQDGREVRVTDTTYTNANARALEGSATLDGNRLQIELTPTNGDVDYDAFVDFVFAPDGGSLCLLAFSDSNGDQGGVGSHYGVRR